MGTVIAGDHGHRDVESLRRMLEPGDVLLFATNRPIARLIRAAEPWCPVNHAALVVSRRGEDSDGRPGVVVATWHCTAASLASGAIVTFDLDRLANPATNVLGVYVMRPDVGDTRPFVANALEMHASGDSWQYNAVGLVAICLGLLARDPRRIPTFLLTAWRCIVGSHPELHLAPPSPLREPSEAVQLITCSEFVYHCFANGRAPLDNALGGFSRSRRCEERPCPRVAPIMLHEPSRLFVLRVFLRQLIPCIRILSEPASTAWVTPGWLYRCAKLMIVGTWPGDGAAADQLDLHDLAV
ncbi:MAG: hypothetical protein ACRDY2_08300 [Acidimicrobiales bacterium]